LTVEKNAGLPENYRLMMNFEYQEKKEGNLLAEIYSLPNLYTGCEGY
jgi:hypothetical protein